MKIAYFSPTPRENPRLGLYYMGRIVDLVESYRKLYRAEPPNWFYDIGDFLANERYGFRIVEEMISTYSASALKNEDIAYDPTEIVYHPITSKEQRVFCVALNYRSHAEETGTPPPERPYIFMKSRTALIGHRSPIIIPRISTAPDHEIELGVVIGRRGKYISRENALEYVAGYTIFNDVSFRDWQMRIQQRLGVDWLHGKNMDSSTPVGPYLVTRDEIENPYSLELILRVNGEIRQRGYTSDMIFTIEEIIENISQGIRLSPGDLIATGTPAGVGHARRVYLKEGDLVEAEIKGLGLLVNPVIREPSEV
ncbi:MAG: fumarylacetoacetate hydrolase family protein [Sulfolobales archaeon]